LEFTRKKIIEQGGQKLSPINVHDIICKIGEIVVNGGMRRSALISLSDLKDKEMRRAKFGKFWKENPHRAMANNSAVYETKPTSQQFLKEWTSLALSRTGERGIFNRENVIKNMPERRRVINKEHIDSFGTNPCSEINLRNKSFCNLSEVICRAKDTKKTLKDKIRIATILGTYQSSLTNFPYISKEWSDNVKEERLLGVSLTGQWDCPVIRDENFLSELKEYAIEINKEYAEKIGINPSVAITCVKPSGTLSQLVDASSGIHPRHAEYYIRRIRINATDPLFHMIKDSGYPYFPEVGQDKDTATTFILEFPVKSPKKSITKDDLSAISLLKHWKN
ncbi:MAG: ribonucleoside-triphosphate reductase, partial [Nanoarchaeota archaeon]